MIRNSKSLGAIIFLFLNFFVVSRYFQLIKFDRDISNTFFHKIVKKNACEPKSDSILGQYKKSGKRVLFIMLDSYPDQILYEEIVGKKSKLHKFLKESSSEYVETSTPIPYTYKSLPYLLGKINVKEKCRFPFLNGYFKPNLILGSSWSSTNESICNYWIKQENFFIRISQAFKKYLRNEERSKWWTLDESCYLSSKDSPEKIISKIKTEKNNRRNISFIVESKFHDVIDPELTNKDADINLISLYDNLYYQSINEIFQKIIDQKLFDELIIMNDHGPRTQFYGKITTENISNVIKKLNYNSYFDRDYYGVFLSKINLNRNNNLPSKNYNFLKSFVPNNKERYYRNSRGEPVYIKKFE